VNARARLPVSSSPGGYIYLPGSRRVTAQEGRSRWSNRSRLSIGFFSPALGGIIHGFDVGKKSKRPTDRHKERRGSLGRF